MGSERRALFALLVGGPVPSRAVIHAARRASGNFQKVHRRLPPERGEESMKHKILLVDDQAELRSLLAENFKARDYEVFEAADGSAVKSLFAGPQPDVVLLDLKLPDADGLDVLL